MRAALAVLALPSALAANSTCLPPWTATCAIVDASGASTQLVDFAVSVSADADGATAERIFTRELGATTMQTVRAARRPRPASGRAGTPRGPRRRPP